LTGRKKTGKNPWRYRMGIQGKDGSFTGWQTVLLEIKPGGGERERDKQFGARVLRKNNRRFGQEGKKGGV